MKHRLFLLAFLLITPAPCCLLAQQADAPPVNVNSVLTTLSQIKKKQHSDITSTETTLAQQLMATASSPADAINYYVNAVYNTQFVGQNREAKVFQDWKKKHEPEFKDAGFRTALCLHLMYLSLAISHDSGVKVKDLLPTLLAYTQQVSENETELAGQEEFMTAPLSKSIFVRSLQIGQYVTDVDAWEPIPINVDGIFDKVILPEFRNAKNATGIFQYWDARIQREETKAANSKRPLDTDTFAKVTKPGLLWQRTEEYVGLGQVNNAINHMVEIIKAYPYHPSTPDWIAEAEKLVKSVDTSAVPAASPVETPAAVAPATASPTPSATPPPMPEPGLTPLPTPPDTLRSVTN